MAFNGAIVFLLAVGLSLASQQGLQRGQEPPPPAEEQQSDQKGRFFLDRNTNQTVTIGTATITTAILAVLIGVLLAGVIGVLSGRDDGASAYAASSGYAATTAYEKNYAVHRSLDDARVKYE
ncbi:uncharacterized protein [Panulirus ornatus]|uniref:uncharacterized protein n=1 Tax=Panulirus ornatus TaxID=150431 RepID=UPI003A882D00